jgi:hypothetical protein
MNHGGLGILPQMHGAFKAFNKNVDKIVLKSLGCRSQKELNKYHLLPTESTFNRELTDKAQVMLRLANGGKVKTVREQEAAMIDKCVERTNWKYAITIILDEGDLHIQSHSRSQGALEKEWQRPISGPEGSSCLSSCYQEINLTGTINAFALTSTSPIITLKLPIPPTYRTHACCLCGSSAQVGQYGYGGR